MPLIFFSLILLFFSQGMKNVETISLDLSESKEIWFIRVVFAEMKKRFAKDHHSLVRKEYKIFLPEGFEL